MAGQENQNNNPGMEFANKVAQAAATVKNAVEAAAKAASGDIAGAVLKVLGDENMRNAIIAIVLIVTFLFTAGSMMIGSAIIGAIEDLARAWGENWQEAWEEQGITSNGSALYLYTIGKISADYTAAWETMVGLFTSDHEVDGKDATNKTLDDGEGNVFAQDDYETTIESVSDEEALVGESGALMKRLDMIKGRVRQRGIQIAALATTQYALDSIGLTIATNLYEMWNNPILYNGIDFLNSSVNIDTSTFQLSDIQAIKIMAAYSIQHDCDLASIDMWDLMDYCGWYDISFDTLDRDALGYESIYQGSYESVFGSEIGGVVAAGQDASSVYILDSPYVPAWKGTFAPQWYYEELEQIRDMNKEYYDNISTGKTELNEGRVPLGVDDAEDEEIDTQFFGRLNSQQTYGIIDSLFSSSNATLTIKRTEYHGADEWVDEALNTFYGAILEAWQKAYKVEAGTTDAGNEYNRSQTGVNSFTLKGASAAVEYYLLNTVTHTRTDMGRVTTDGEDLLFDNLAGSTLYEVYKVTTEIVELPTSPPDPSSPTDPSATTGATEPAPTEVNVTEELIDSFTTFADTSANQAYQLQLTLDIGYISKSVDELTLELIGLWPGSKTDTITGSDGREYAENYRDNQLFAQTWQDAYVAPDGTTYILDFERQQDYQYETYMDLVTNFAEMLGYDYIGLYEPDYGYGDTIVSLAEREAECYAMNNISGGARYWEICNKASGVNNGTTQPWCVCFVVACGVTLNYIGPGRCWGNFNDGSWIYSCSRFYNYMVNGGYAQGHNAVGDGYKPVPGDLVLYGRSLTNGAYDHIGIVKEVKDNGALVTIEGNVRKSSAQRGFRVVRECDWNIQYKIGSEAYVVDGEQYYIVAYLHPDYPAAYNTNAIYLSIGGTTAALTRARYVGSGSNTVLIAGVGRFRESQLPDVVAELKEAYPELYREELQTALDGNDMAAFVEAWNAIINDGKNESFKAAQQSICANHYVRPVVTKVKDTTGFNWAGTQAREELLLALVTTSDQKNALTFALTALCQGLDNSITDEELITHLNADDFFSSTLESYRGSLWPTDPESIQNSWILGLKSALHNLE